MRDPACWARRFSGLCGLGFLTLVLLGAAWLLGGHGAGREDLLFCGAIVVALATAGLASLGESLAWRLSPFARACLLTLVAALDLAELAAASTLVVLALTG